MKEIGIRLREERLRLGLDQETFGAIGGVKKNAQSNYENGIRNPDSEYLAAIAAADVDVLYVLTGSRVPVSNLSNEESALVDNYRAATAERKMTLTEVSAALAQPEIKKAEPR